MMDLAGKYVVNLIRSFQVSLTEIDKKAKFRKVCASRISVVLALETTVHQIMTK